MEEYFAIDVLSHLMRKAAADKDYATLQLCLECRPIESVGHQELGYFLAVQKDPLMFKLLFAACETSILAKNNEVADSLIRSLGYCFRDCRSACSVPLLDWTGDKLIELIQDQAHIHPVQMLCEGAAQVSSSVARRGRSGAVTEHLHGRRPIPLVTAHLQPGGPCHE
jgi:hypothetical protein